MAAETTGLTPKQFYGDEAYGGEQGYDEDRLMIYGALQETVKVAVFAAGGRVPT